LAAKFAKLTVVDERLCLKIFGVSSSPPEVFERKEGDFPSVAI